MVCYLAEGAGERHPPLQLAQDLLLQGVPPPSFHAASSSSSSGSSSSFSRQSSLQLFALAVHEVVVDVDKRFVMVLWLKEIQSLITTT